MEQEGEGMTELSTTVQNSSDEELKPCPFCGEESPYYLCDDTGEHILCPNCLNELRSQVVIGKDALVKEWNRRVSE